MKLTDIKPSLALSPLDGRYHKQTEPLLEYLSEAALNRQRIAVEIEWMIQLANGTHDNNSTPAVPGVDPLTAEEISYLRRIPKEFGPDSIRELAEIEAVTRHDVKAVEYNRPPP